MYNIIITDQLYYVTSCLCALRCPLKVPTLYDSNFVQFVFNIQVRGSKLILTFPLIGKKILIVQLFLDVTNCGSNVFLSVNVIIF